jgi:predicted ATP-grasp superfamily ATP-dependent carboligase
LFAREGGLRMRILITGARAPVALELARQFHRAGHHVDLADSVRLPLARSSRAVRRSFVVAPPVSDPDRFTADVLSIVRRRAIDLIVPVSEEIFFLAARLEAFSGSTEVFAEPLDRLAKLHNKWEFVRLVAELGTSIEAPATHLLRTGDDLRPWRSEGASATDGSRDAERDPSDWVFKPAYSRFASRTLIGPTEAELAKLQPDERDPWIAQRRIRGCEYSTYGVARCGKLRAHACYRSEYRAGIGSGIYFRPQNRPAIRRFVEQFVERLGFTGQIAFDFITDGDGRTYVLECNPRATSGAHLFAPGSLAAAFGDDEGPIVEPISAEPVMLSSIMILYSVTKALRRGGLKAVCGDMLRANDAMFAWHDPLPAILAPLTLLEVAFKAWRENRSLEGAATYDLEWNGEAI